MGAASKGSGAPSRFRQAIEAVSQESIAVIAEVKAASPSAGTIAADPAVEEIARAYARGGATAISVVTEPLHFRGSPTWIARAARATGLPLLMKDFFVDARQIDEAVLAGADAVLLIAAILTDQEMTKLLRSSAELRRDAVVEVHDEAELRRALDAGASIVGVNNRDLRDFSVSLETSERIARLIPRGVVAISESGIRTAADVERMRRSGFRACLVGEALLRASDRAGAVRALLGAQ
jgi:indole-3-glycerol phosphate synthase